MIAKTFKINSPVWSIRGVGLNFEGLRDTDIVAVYCEYRNKQNDLVFPDVYMDSVINIKKNHRYTKKVYGKMLYIIAFDKFTVSKSREDYEAEYKRPVTEDSQEA